MLVNVTPHPVVIYGQGDTVLADIPASGVIARIAETVTPCPAVDGLPGSLVTLGEIEGLPEPVEGTWVIVSMPLAMAALAARSTRADLVYPYGQVRDGGGRIIGCRSLGTITSA